MFSTRKYKNLTFIHCDHSISHVLLLLFPVFSSIIISYLRGFVEIMKIPSSNFWTLLFLQTVLPVEKEQETLHRKSRGYEVFEPEKQKFTGWEELKTGVGELLFVCLFVRSQRT